MISKLLSLRKYFIKIGLKYEYELVNRLIKICSIPGVDAPADEVTVDPDDIYEHLSDMGGEGPGRPNGDILIDSPRKTKKRFGQKNYKKMPFHYGEFVEINNPADDMGWDVVLVPSAQVEQDASQEKIDHVSAGHNFIPVGYVPVNDSQEEWTKRTKSPKRPEGKRAPVGNDKIILAPDGVVTDEDRREIEEFFGPMWNFKDIIWL